MTRKATETAGAASATPARQQVSAIEIRGLDHVVFRTINLDRMSAFYMEVLGCTIEREGMDGRLIQMRAGNALIDLLDVAAEPEPAPGEAGRNVDHVCLGLKVWDEAAIRRHLKAHGVEAGETGQRYGAGGMGPAMYLSDPDGNGIELRPAAG